MRPAIALLAAGLLAMVDARAADDAIELVPIASVTFEGSFASPWMPPRESGRPVTIHGVLRLPAGDRRVPAVVLLHGCSGISASETAWARSLRDHGYATLIVASFGGRGIASVCRSFERVHAMSLLADAFAGFATLAGHPRVDAARIAVLGVSLGGRPAVWAAYDRLRTAYAADPGRFVAHVAIHSASCLIDLADDPEGPGGAPLLLVHGHDDDWVPATRCREQIERWRQRSIDAELRIYEGAAHAFDHEGLAHREVHGIANFGACRFSERGGRIVDESGREAGHDAACVRRLGHVGYDAAASARAHADVAAFLARALRGR
jgi:dienelactone hydrolase